MTASMQRTYMKPMSPTDGEGCRPPGADNVQTQRALDPHTSIEGYSRSMLQYMQSRMAGFVDLDEDRGSATSRSNRSSDSSAESGGEYTSGVLSRQNQGNASGASSSGNSFTSKEDPRSSAAHLANGSQSSF